MSYVEAPQGGWAGTVRWRAGPLSSNCQMLFLDDCQQRATIYRVIYNSPNAPFSMSL